MSNDGGPMYPQPIKDGHPPDGASIRDRFAMAIVAGEGIPLHKRGNVCTRLLESEQVAEVQDVYRYAQLLTDEKLRRDQADSDEGTAG